MIKTEDGFIFSSAKERDRFEKKFNHIEKLTKKTLEKRKNNNKPKITKSWTEAEINILLNNALERCLILIVNKRESAILSKYKKVNPKPKRIKDIGNPLELNYKNDYSKRVKHLPVTKSFNKKLIRIALRKT